MERALLETNLDGVRPPYRGKVRDVYDLEDSLLIVATDRISAYDCVMPNGIPDKGKILTAMSLFWFRFLGDLIDHHVITSDVEDFPDVLRPHAHVLKGRSMLVRKAQRFDVECIVRGYLAGSGWKDYQKTGSISGLELPEGLRESGRLPEPIFTPSTKAEVGHDENISFESMRELVGNEQADSMRAKSVELYQKAERYAVERGIIIADTKFAFPQCAVPAPVLTGEIAESANGVFAAQINRQFVRMLKSFAFPFRVPPGPRIAVNGMFGQLAVERRLAAHAHDLPILVGD